MRRCACGILVALLACAGGGAPPARASAGLPPVRHVWVIMLENKSIFETFGPGLATAPYLTRSLPAQGVLLPFYYGIGHSSLDNYIAILSGQAPAPQTQDDCPDSEYHTMQAVIRGDGQAVDTQSSGAHGCIYPKSVPTLAGQLSAHGFDWKGYNEGIPGNCSTRSGGTDNPHYKRKHNPYMFFQGVLESGLCAQRVVGLPPLGTDLQRVSTTPNFAFVIPDQCNDAHDQCEESDPSSLGLADRFLRHWVPLIQKSPAYKQDGLIIVTFDEGSDPLLCCGEVAGPNTSSPGGAPGTGGGITGAVLLSPFIKPGSVSLGSFNHYSLLRSLEDLFGIDQHLGFAGQGGLTGLGADIFDNPDGGMPAPPEVAHLAVIGSRRPRAGRRRIAVGFALSAIATVTASLKSGTATVARAVRRFGAAGPARLRLPRARLRAGVYRITLRPAGGEPVSMRLRVRR